jgi:hypothetical protein
MRSIAQPSPAAYPYRYAFLYPYCYTFLYLYPFLYSLADAMRRTLDRELR